MTEEITCGADIEFIGVAANQLSKSVEGKIGGNKEKPVIVKYGNLQEDNVLPEIAIDVVKTKTDFIRNIVNVKASLADALGEHAMHFDIRPYTYMSVDELKTEQAQKFACDPDSNCWTGKENPPPVPSDPTTGKFNLRTAGGHVHFGFPEAQVWGTSRQELAQWFDIFLGVHHIAHYKGCKIRQDLYGKPGAYRSKPYGIEYRVLSNWWVESTQYMSWVWDQMFRAYEYFQMGEVDRVLGPVGEEVQDIIASSVPANAKHFFNKYGLQLIQP